MTATVSKLATLPSWDAHYADMQTNNGAVEVEQSGNTVALRFDDDALVTFPSSNAAQGEHKWIGLDIATNLDSIVGATWNGSTMTQADADEAAGVGLAAGHIVFWIKADALPVSVTIGAEGKEAAALTFHKA